jgi:hypothetical protein
MKKSFWQFEKAREYIRGIGLKNKKEWKKWYKENKPRFVPSNPNYSYKDKWLGFPDWMGYDFNIHFNKKYSINEDFFKVWTHDMAYAFGFWLADGHIYNGWRRNKKTKYVFGISQCEQYILEEILKAMMSNYPIHTEKKEVGTTSYRFLIESEEIVKDIIALGGEYKKSLISKFPNVPKDFLPDFIRGLWDGDGSAFISGKRCCATFSCGSKKFIDAFRMVLIKKVGLKNTSIVKDKRRLSAYNIVLQPNDSRRLRDYIYKNQGICLKRKKDMFYNFGEINLSTKERGHLFYTYEDFKKIVQKKNFSGQDEFFKWARHQKNNLQITCSPSIIYKNRGWTDWYDFLGKTKRKDTE